MNISERKEKLLGRIKENKKILEEEIKEFELNPRYKVVTDEEGYLHDPSHNSFKSEIPEHKKIASNGKDIVSIVIFELNKEASFSDVEEEEEYDEDKFEETVKNWLAYRIEDRKEREVVGDLTSTLIARNKGSLLAKFVKLRTEANSTEIDFPYICQFLTCSFLPEELAFIAQHLDPELFKLLHGYVFQKDRLLLAAAFYNMNVLFPWNTTDYDIEGLKQVLVKAERFNNEYFREYVSKLIKIQKRKDDKVLQDEGEDEEIDYVDKPEWITSFRENRLYTHEELLELLPNLAEQEMMRSWNLADVIIQPGPWVSQGPEEDAMFISKLHTIDYDQEAMRIAYLNRFSRMETNDREELIDSVIRNSKLLHLSKSEEVFRILGPSWADTGHIALQLESDDPCLLYGGHRSMTCYEEENSIPENKEKRYENPVEDNQLHLLDWFTGRCDQCNRNIRYKHYGMRMPCDEGAWRGCYCSSKCMEEEINEEEGNDTNIGVLHLEMIWEMEGQYKAFGIYERLPEKTTVVSDERNTTESDTESD